MFNNNDGELFNVVKIKKEELLSVLKDNLEKHIKDVAEAIELRRNNIINIFDKVSERIESDITYVPSDNFSFPKPVDSSNDYRTAIRMVEMTQDKIIELNERQFDKLVMDNWEWKRNLVSTSALYGKSI